jgi:hypothetical protein
MRRVLAVVVVLLAVGAGLGAGRIDEVIDQASAPAVSPGITFALGGPVSQVLSQTVTVGVTGVLAEVRLAFGCADDARHVVLEIRDVASNGQPGQTVYRHRVYPASHFPSVVTNEFRSLDLGGGLDFTAGDQFAIVVTTDGGSCGAWPGEIGDLYNNGTAWADANDGPIVPLSLGTGRDDLAFQTVMRVR